jgi:hypothetical protein
MNRHQRRKLARARKDAKGAILNARAMQVLKEETQKRSLSERRPNRFERSGCLGNRGIYQAVGMFPAPGYTSGAFKEKPMGEARLRELRSTEK